MKQTAPFIAVRGFTGNGIYEQHVLSASDAKRQARFYINLNGRQSDCFGLLWHRPCSCWGMAKLKPSIRSTETFTETNFLRLHIEGEDMSANLVTLEHFSYSAVDGDRPGWSCQTIVDAERMSSSDAEFIARTYASEHDVPVIYQSHAD